MADPIDMLDTPVVETPPLADNNVSIDRDELARLQLVAQQFQQAAPILDEYQRRRDNPPQSTPPPSTESPDDEFWKSPTAATAKLIADQVSPYARQVAAQLGTMVANNYKSTKTTDRFFAGVMPHFERKLGGIDKNWLGTLTPDQQSRVLDEAWLASKGAFLDESERKRPPVTPPVNLGGGDSRGATSSTTQKKSLQEIDAGAYRMAMQRGWSQERMDQVAAEIMLDLENDK